MSPIIEHISKKATPRKLDEHQIAVISAMTEACGDLLTQHFKDIESVRKDNTTCSAQVSINFTIGYDGGNAVVNTNIGFSKKYKDGREDHVSDPRQQTLFTESKSKPSEKLVKRNGHTAKSRVDFGTPVSEVIDQAKVKGSKKSKTSQD
jgi:hypothetical protein